MAMECRSRFLRTCKSEFVQNKSIEGYGGLSPEAFGGKVASYLVLPLSCTLEAFLLYDMCLVVLVLLFLGVRPGSLLLTT